MKKLTLSQAVRCDAELLNEKEAAALLDLKPGTLAVFRSTGRHRIPFLKIGRNVRYRRSDLESWLAACTRSDGITE
jgi:excisionase family DNA binding protein